MNDFIKQVEEEFTTRFQSNKGINVSDTTKNFLTQKLKEAYELGVKEGYDEEVKRQHLRIVQV